MQWGRAMDQAESLPFAGTRRFEVRGSLGQGASGFIYDVLDREHRTRLALKTLRTPNAEAIMLLKHEFRAAQGISHPNLVTLHELFEEDGEWFFTMERVRGVSFTCYVAGERGADVPEEALDGHGHDGHDGHPSSVRDASGVRVSGVQPAGRGPRFDEAKLRAALLQLARGLCALHRNHKVHRDIKPSNVLVTAEGRVVILDFGIVRDLARKARDEGIVGTVAYMAPEQAAEASVGPPADWYSVGVVLYQALTGVLPFVGSLHEVLAQKVSREAVAPHLVIGADESLPPDLAELCAELLRTDPLERPDGEAILGRLGDDTKGASHAPAAGATAFIGRARELRQLEAAFDETRTGRGVTLLVEGESGVGKSHLVSVFTERAAVSGDVLVFHGRCYERESLPYKAVDPIIDDICQYLATLSDEEAHAQLPEQAGLLRRIFPVFERVDAVADARITQWEVQNPQEIRARVFAILRELVGNLARTAGGIVFVIDDLQWADADSLALLAELLRPPDAPPVFLLATIRSGTESRRHAAEIGAAIARLPGDVRTLRLEPLGAADARALATALLSHVKRDVSDATLDGILAEAKGHPLFLDELVRHRRLDSDAATDGEGASAPTRLDDALWERASRLPSAQRRLLEAIAVASVPVAQEVIANAAAVDFGELFALVGALRTACFVRTSGVARANTVEAYHDRVRESVLGNLDDETRREWHARLAVALERAPSPDLEMLLTQWRGAGNLTRASEYAVRAADAANGALAFDHAASLYTLALELSSPSPAMAKELALKLADALTNAGRGVDAARVYLRAAGASVSLEAIDMRRRAAEELMCSGHVDEGRSIFDAVLASVGIRTPKSPGAVIVALLFSTLWITVRGLGFTPRAANAVDPKALLKVDCLYSAGSGYGMSDHVRGKAFHVQTLLAALAVGEPTRIARALAFYAAAHASAGGPAYAKTMRMQAVVAKLARELKLPIAEALAVTAAAYGYHFSGQWVKATTAFARAEQIFREQCVGVTYEINSVRTLHFRALATRGAVRELETRAEASLREAEQRGDRYATVNLRSNAMVFLALARDDAEGAARELALATNDLTGNGFFVQHFFCMLAEAYVALYEGDAPRALRALDDRDRAVKRSLLLHVQPLRILVADVRARASLMMYAASAADPVAAAKARRKVETALKALDREDMGWSRPLADLARAGLAHAAAGGRDATLNALAKAESGFDRADMALHAAVARRRRGVVLGGHDGAAMVASADGWLREAGVANAVRMTAYCSPGFGIEGAPR